MTAPSKRGYVPLVLSAAIGLVPVLAMAQDQPQPLDGSAATGVSPPVVAAGPAFFGGISVAKVLGLDQREPKAAEAAVKEA